MDDFEFASAMNIKRYEDLLTSSTDEPNRRTIQTLLAEELAASPGWAAVARKFSPLRGQKK